MWWFIAPLAIGIATFALFTRPSSQPVTANATELLRHASEAFVNIPEGKILHIHRTMTGMSEREDGVIEYGVTNRDDLTFNGDSYIWTMIDPRSTDETPEKMLATTFGKLSDNGITYTKYEWVPEGCMENDGDQTCYKEQIVSYEIGDTTRHEAELHRRANERGISQDDTSELKEIAQQLACNEELNVYTMERSPLYELLYAQSNLRQVQEYLSGDTWCSDSNCPFVYNQETGERVIFFLTPTMTIEGALYHIIVPYNTEAVKILTGDDKNTLQWEIWIREDGLPSREILRKNGDEVQGVTYGFDYTDAAKNSDLLTFDGWRKAKNITEIPHNPSFAPWGYSQEEAEYERSLRIQACESGSVPVSRSGGTTVPSIQIP